MKKIGALFPGQGSQYVGMGKKLYERFENVRALFDAADKALGLSLTELCFNGPEEELRKTYNTQPAILLASYAVWTVLEQEVGITPILLAGHSLGEYTALVASGALSLEDGVKLTRKRGLLMEEACPAGIGGMNSSTTTTGGTIGLPYLVFLAYSSSMNNGFPPPKLLTTFILSS